MKLKRREALKRFIPRLGKGAHRLGEALLRTPDQPLGMCALFARLVVYSFSRVGRRIIFRETLKQIYFTALQGIVVVIYSALILGLLVIVHAAQYLAKVQGEEYVGWLLVTLVVRELGPLWVALFVLIRSCTAIIVELGNMSVTGEVEALKTMGIDPYRYLGIPRFWGVTISVAALYVLTVFIAIFGGFLFANLLADVFWGDFWRSFLHSLEWIDLAAGFSRSITFGMIIATVSVYFGFKPQNNLGEVARYTSQGAKICLVLCASMDLVMVTIFYL
jgi:phospholipid/cholesterol/gamma-HCH transport system permease protein